MPDNIDHRSTSYAPATQIDDLIGVAPGWLLRSGITVIVIVTSVILAVSAFIKYPDKIIAKGIMTSQNPPIEHLNKIGGIIEEIFVENGAVVREKDPLVYIKNTTNRDDLKILKSFILNYQSITQLEEILELRFPKGLQLGELQNDYGQLQLEISQLQQTLRQSGVFQQINTLKNEIGNTRELREILIAEKDYSKEELALIQRDFQRNVLLNKEGVVSDLDREKVESEWLRYQKQYSNLGQGIIQNKIREEQLILEIQKLTEDRNTRLQINKYNVEQVINSIQSGMKEWEEKYMIDAKIEGSVAFVPKIVEDQYLNQNTVVLSVIPTNNVNTKQIQVLVNNYGLGKIDIGDKVIIKVDGYPYKEFGTLTSKVQSISALPEITKNNNGEFLYLYTINIALPDTIITNHQQEIPYRPNSSVTAEIITKDKSILERLFETFLSLINQE
ncbi:MAG: HlyD family efflux transporter periplasmic adaptor subunit [Bacteroidetes bacterium]|nr:HlyD family efflux transporter periplasmic adaptor subunit [Bacteroidota bacterium]